MVEENGGRVTLHEVVEATEALFGGSGQGMYDGMHYFR